MMHILDSTVTLQAQHELQRSQSFSVAVSSQFRGVFAEAAANSEPTPTSTEDEHARIVRLLKELADAIMAAMAGKTCRTPAAGGTVLPVDGAASAEPERSYEWACRISQQQSEQETTAVCGRGQVTTADGRCLDFSFSTQLSRSEVSSSEVLQSGSIKLKDPLMLGFSGNTASLSGQRIDFDLDADGQPEQIPGIGEGCGFLVFDKNGNGRADDGSELFGALSGNGFADLAKLDSDGNGWIDAADPAFAQLGVWRSDGYASLAKLGIGALYTGSTAAPFTLKDGAGGLLGQIRAAGLYLDESGRAGRINQVDLAASSVAPAEGEPEQG